MIKLEITFETKKELCEFLSASISSDPGLPTTATVDKPKATKPKAEKSKPKAEKSKPKADKPKATAAQVRKALKAFATKHDPSAARGFLESRGVASVSGIEDSPAAYAEVLDALAAHDKELSDG